MKSDKKKAVSPRVFLNAPLSNIAAQTLNTKIKRVLEEEGFICISPQEILPPSTNVDSREILKQNVEFVKQCDIILSVLDAPGEGVIFELGFAYAIGKPIVAFRSNRLSYLGKVIEGLWSELPESQKAASIDELRTRLKHFRASGGISHSAAT
jgi:nucleoside 2-deoxyribosyltransferase